MSHPATPVDPNRCPLCGRSNQCAVSAALPPEDCWCMSTPMSPAALAQIPDSARNQACLCPACAALAPPAAADRAPI